MMNNTTSVMPTQTTTSIAPYAPFVERVILACLFFIIAIVGSVGNLMVIAAVGLSKTLQTKTNAYVVSLSFGDCLACLAMPWWGIALLSGDEWLIPGTEWICTASGMMIFSSIGVSVWAITYIAVNRLILITRSKAMYHKVYTIRNITIMLVVSHIVCITFVTMPTFVGFGRIGFVPESHTCSDILLTSTAELYDIYQGLTTGLLVTTIFACYIRIYLHVRQHFGQMKKPKPSVATSATTLTELSSSSPTDVENSINKRAASNHNSKINRDMIEITKNLFMCVIILIICLVPISAVNIIYVPPRYHVYAWVVSFANSAVNPLIYSWRHPHFKVILRLMLQCRYADIPQPSEFLQKYST